MTNATSLDDLLVLFDEAKHAYVAEQQSTDWKAWGFSYMPADILAMDPETVTHLSLIKRDRPIYSTAMTYLIARDDGMEAAMLWKLANGGVV